MMALLVGWRYVALITGLVGTIGLAIYPIIIDPMANPDKYKRIQEGARVGIRQEDIQPGRIFHMFALSIHIMAYNFTICDLFTEILIPPSPFFINFLYESVE